MRVCLFQGRAGVRHAIDSRVQPGLIRVGALRNFLKRCFLGQQRVIGPKYLRSVRTKDGVHLGHLFWPKAEIPSKHWIVPPAARRAKLGASPHPTPGAVWPGKSTRRPVAAWAATVRKAHMRARPR